MTLALIALLTAPQQKIYVSPTNLPRPGRSSVLKNPKVVARPSNYGLKVPPGFHANLWATGLKSPRWLLVAPNGDVFCTESYQGNIVLLRDRNRSGRADEPIRFASGLNLPFGMAIQDGWFYVANTNSVVRFKYQLGQSKVSNPETVVSGIPSKGYRQHWTRNILFEPDGKHFFLTIGSETNKDKEPLPRAAIWRYGSDGSGKELVATGLRNPVGLAFRPGTAELWSTVVERDYMGNNLVPDFFTRIKQGQNYGWPEFYIGNHPDPVFRKSKPSKAISVPDVLFHAHSTPLGVLFYTGNMFPEQYRGDALVAMRGSTNRQPRSGYMVARVDFQNGKPARGYEEFVGGFIPDRTKNVAYGRPVGIGQLPDGSVLVTDEGAGLIWRITYGRSS